MVTSLGACTAAYVTFSELVHSKSSLGILVHLFLPKVLHLALLFALT